MKKILTLIFTAGLLLNVNTFFSQSKVEPGTNIIEFEEAEFHEKMLGSSGNFFYSLRMTTSGKGITYYVEKFNKSDRIKTLNFSIGKFSNDKAIGGAYPVPKTKVLISCAFKNGILSVFSHRNEDYEQRQYLVDSYNLNDGQQIETERVLFSVPITKENFYKMAAMYSLSPDSSKMALLNAHENFTEGAAENNLCLYDLVTKRMITTKKMSNLYQGKKICLNSFCVDNDANLYYTFFQKGGVSFLSKYNAVSDKADVLTLKSNGITNVMKFDDKQNFLYIYAKNYTLQKAENTFNYSISNLGFYSAKIDIKSFSLIGEKMNLFGQDIISKLICNKSEGGVSIEGTLNFYDSGNDEYYVVWDNHSKYYAGEIIVTKLNSKFDILWSKIIPRAISPRVEIGVEDNSSSLSVYENNKLNFLFLEHPKFELKNLDYTIVSNCETPLLRTFPNTNVVCYTIGSNGNIKKEILYLNEKEWLILDPQPIKTGGKYIIRFKKGKKENFGTLSVN
ncbi:MAG: hypothetical protein V4677_15860 [Bacteroidota bacterium]